MRLRDYYELTDLGDISSYLSIKVTKDEGIYSINQTGYIEKLIKTYGRCKGVQNLIQHRIQKNKG